MQDSATIIGLLAAPVLSATSDEVIIDDFWARSGTVFILAAHIG